ncbi:trypsin 3A1-like [Amyelois transitella]|uniref:trypsin 3A1-like n=1 Tax=Amyelois transitella TaxID=680683 RepID=UPI00298FE4F4|nr:trypsin 3A1-like [Amyelois transitella]
MCANYTGRLTSECVEKYYRTFVTRSVPPRNYKYFHELTPEDVEDQNDYTEIAYRIVGGKQISIEQAPYQVLYGKFCGGTLIAPEWVITAAHCQEKEDFVYLGSTYRSQAIPYRICAHFTHPLHTSSPNSAHSHDYDYQLVLLEQPVPITRFSRPIAIGNVDDVRPGNMIAVSGWGHAVFKQRKMEDILRQVSVPIITREKCIQSPHSMYQNITERMFCAGYEEGAKDSCQGDSGGPAVLKGKIVGLVSFGVGCALKEFPGVYTNIPLARKWIRSVVGLPL